MQLISVQFTGIPVEHRFAILASQTIEKLSVGFHNTCEITLRKVFPLIVVDAGLIIQLSHAIYVVEQ